MEGTVWTFFDPILDQFGLLIFSKTSLFEVFEFKVFMGSPQNFAHNAYMTNLMR